MSIQFNPFYFVRHGQTDWNFKGIYMGTRDIPLNQTGIEQAHGSLKFLDKEPIETIVASPLLRAAQTAEIISAHIKKPIIYMDEFKETNWGAMEGQSHGGDFLKEWFSGYTPCGAESFIEFEKRVLAGFNKIFSLKGPVLIVSHGGTYVVIQKHLKLPFKDILNAVPYYHQPPEQENHPWFCCELGNGEYS